MTHKYRIPRTLFVSDVFPPFVSGSVTMMHNLFLGLDAGNSILVTQGPERFSPSRAGGYDPTCSVEIARREIPGIPSLLVRGFRWGLPAAIMMSQVPAIVSEAVRAAKEVDAQVVMTCWPFGHFTTAGWLVARKLKLPFTVYLHSLWYETRRELGDRIIAKLLEPTILRGATQVLVATPPTAAYLDEKMGLKCDVLEHSVNSQLWPLDNEIRIQRTPRSLLMLGSVNKFNLDSVVAFTKAIAQIPGIQLTILTGQSIEQLQDLGVDCSRVTNFFCPRDQLKETILKADALYVALGFDTPVQKEVEVVIPTRLVDYLPTGIPIVAHGPKNTWTIQEARTRGWGYVIDSLDAGVVKSSMEAFLDMPGYEKPVLAAWDEARRRDYLNQSGILANYLWQTAASKTPLQ